MPQPRIIQGKLSPPTPPGGWVRRRFAMAPETPVALLVGGPGYGKTLGLLTFFTDAVEAETPALWYTVDALDTDPATFFHHLLVGMRAHIPQFGEEVSALSLSDTAEPRLLWQAFFDALASFNLPAVTLVLDDFQHLMAAQPALAAALPYFFDKLPAGTRLRIASRQRFATPLARLTSRGLVAMLDVSALRFSAAEEASFLAACAPGGVSSDLQALVAGLDGWPLGLELASASRDADSPRQGPLTALGPLRGYLSEELFEVQPLTRRAFMLEVALLQDVTPEACRRVFERDDAAEQLEALESAHLILALGDGVGYRYPTYLREFLLAELARTVLEGEQARWHGRAAAFFLSGGQSDLAVPHALASGDKAVAIAACRAAFPTLRYTGRMAQLRRWLDAFRPEVVAGEPWLLLWQGHAQAQAGRNTEARQAYAEAQAGYQRAGDAAGTFKALVGQCNTALTLQDMPAFHALLGEALAHTGDRDDADVVDLWLIRAYEGERRGDLAQMQACNEAALGLPIGHNVDIAASHCIALMNLASYGFHRGELKRAAESLTRAVDTAGAWGFYPYKLAASFMRAHLHLHEGDLESAGTFLTALPAFWKEQLDWHDLGIAQTVLGFYHQMRGEWREAEEALHAALATFAQAGFQEGRKVPLERLMWLALQRKQYNRVETLADEAHSASVRDIYDMAIVLPRARGAHLDGRQAEALALLDAVVPDLERVDARLHLARARLFEAASRLASGDRPGADLAFSRALALIEAGQYAMLLGQDQLLWEELAPLAVARRSRPLADGSPGDRLTVARYDDTRPGRLSLRCLGAFEVRLDGILLDQWPRRKAKLLLAALALHPDGLTQQALAEWVGHGEAHPDNVLRINLWALRRMFEPTLAKGAPSRFVLHEGDRYRLAADMVDFVDLRAFEEALRAAEAHRDASPVEATAHYERALGHVRGSLFDEGRHFDVFDLARDRYRQLAVDALGWLAAHRRQYGDYGRAESSLLRAVALAPADEAVYLALMRLYRAQGATEKLRRAYWDCRKALKRQVGLEPSAGFEAAYREML